MAKQCTGQMLSRLRALIKQADPEVVEEWKWRGVPHKKIKPRFSDAGGRQHEQAWGYVLAAMTKRLSE